MIQDNAFTLFAASIFVASSWFVVNQPIDAATLIDMVQRGARTSA